MQKRHLIAALALSALSACQYFETKPAPEPSPPADAPYTQPVPVPQPYPTPQPEPYPTVEPYPAPQPEPYPTVEPYPAPQPEPYPTVEPYPAPQPQPYPTDPGTGGGPVSDAAITLEEGPCFGTCPIYTMRIYPTEFYELDAGQFTVNPGQSTGTLPAGSWAAARTALQTADFNTLPTDVTQGNPAACGNQVATDLPTAIISETTIAGTRTVTYYPGCFQAPDKPALDQLVASLRMAMQIETLVAP